MTPYTRTSNFKGKRERAFNYCFIDIQGRFKQNHSLNCMSFECMHECKQFIDSRRLNNQASRNCEVSVEVLMLD